MDSHRSLNELDNVFRYYGGRLTKFQRAPNNEYLYAGTDSDRMYREAYALEKIDLEAVFSDIPSSHRFINDMCDMHEDRIARDHLFRQYPALAEAHEQYQTLLKLYGG